MKIIFDRGDLEDYWNEMKLYLEISNKFIDEQAKWLKEQKAYMNRQDYKFFVPHEIKELARLQYISREADLKETEAIREMVKTTDPNRQKEYTKIIIDQVKIANEVDDEFERIWKKGISNDWRMRFIKVPLSICPKDNLNIPNVLELLSPPKQVNFSPVS